MNHKCKNPKFCPICRQKIRKKIINFFKNNPNIRFSWYDIADEFDMNLWTARYILDSLAKKRIIIRSYGKTKRLTVKSGVRVHFLYPLINKDLARFNSNHA